MSWLTPSASDLQAVLGQAQLDTFAKASPALDGGPDLITDTLAKVVAEVRGYLLPFTFDFGPDGTIPAECMRHAMVLAACMLMVRMNVELPKSKEEDRKAAVAYFLLVSKGEIRVAGNSIAANALKGAVLPSMQAKVRTFGRAYEDGI